MQAVNVFLIGYRCSGKTTVGRHLAQSLGWPFVDTDALVAADLGASIADVVRRRGWEAFRLAERHVLAAVCARRRQVVATGGGVPCDAANVQRMKQNGVLVWLRAGEASIEKRMRKDAASALSRPALGGKDALQEIRRTLEARRPLYRAAADLWVHTDDLCAEAVRVAVTVQLARAGCLAQFGRN